MIFRFLSKKLYKIKLNSVVASTCHQNVIIHKINKVCNFRWSNILILSVSMTPVKCYKKILKKQKVKHTNDRSVSQHRFQNQLNKIFISIIDFFHDLTTQKYPSLLCFKTWYKYSSWPHDI